MADSAVTSAKIAADTIVAADIATSAVETTEILDATILTGDIAADTILAGNIATGAVATAEILDSTITTSDIAANTILEADIATGAVATAEILDATILEGDLADSAVTSAKIAANTIVADDIATSGVATAEILNATIIAEDLAADLAITTTGLASLNGGIAVDTDKFTVAGDGTGDVLTAGDLDVNGDDIDSDGTLDITGATGMNINTTAGDITLDPAGNDVLPGGDSADNIGADATRWATIFADTLNYSAALTDDNSATTTVTMGDTATDDVVNITAKTAINAEHWDITESGAAEFISVGAVTPGTGKFTTLEATDTLSFTTNGDSMNNATDATFDFTRNTAGTVTITSSDDDVNADMTILAGGTGDITLGDADSDTTIAGKAVIGDGGDDVAINSNDWDIASDGTVTGLTGITSAMITDETIVSADIDDGTIAGGDLATNIAITTTGAVDFSGASSMKVPTGALNYTDNDACTTDGLVVFDSTNNHFFGCDGFNWQQLD